MIGWTDLVAANLYFSTKRLESTAWDALTATSGGKDEKTAVLNMAYDRLRFCKDFTIPAAPTAAQLEGLALAQHETAYYLALHLKDEDRRKGLHAQGVIMANIVKEVSSGEQMDKLPLPQMVYHIMESLGFLTPADQPFYAVEIDRDEDEDIDTDVTDD